MGANGWSAVQLGEILVEHRKRVAVEPDVLYPIAGVYGFGRGVLRRDAVRGSDISASALYRMRHGQIIYSRLKAFEGAFAVVPAEADGRYVSNEFPTFNVNEQCASAAFIGLVLSLPATWRELTERITGIGARRERLQVVDFLEFELDLPPIDEQHAIVALVGAAAELVSATRDETEAAFDLLRSATEKLLLTDDGWDELPGDWKLTELGDISDIRSGITKGRKPRGELRPAPFIRAANVQNGYLDLTEIKTLDVSVDEVARFALQPGDVLLVEGSGSVHRLGRGWIWAGEIDPCVHQNHVFRVRPDPTVVRPRFLAHVLSASVAREHFAESAKTTSGLATINKSQTAACPIPLPPLEMQDDLLVTLDALRRAGVEARRAASAAERMQSTLVEELLSGERRVRL